MIEYLLSLSLLIAAVLLIRAIFRKTVSPRAIYALWLVVVVRMLLPITLFEVDVTIPAFLQNQQTEQMESQEQLQGDSETMSDVQKQSPTTSPAQTTPTSPAQNTTTVTPSVTTPVTPVVPAETSPVTPITPETEVDAPMVPEESVSVNWKQIANLIWFIGVVIAAAWVIFTSITYSSRLYKDRRYHKTIRGTKVYVSESTGVPCIAGLIPSIYITPEAANSKSEMLIIIHEHVHLRHGDHIWSIVRALALIVFWWNPLIWAAATVSKQDAELACDDAISAKLNDEGRLKYANILLDTIPQRHRYATGLGSAPMKERILMLTTRQKNRWICLVLAVVLALSAVGCAFVSLNEKTDEVDAQHAENSKDERYTINVLVNEKVTDGYHDRNINIIEVDIDSEHEAEINEAISTFFLDKYNKYLEGDGRNWTYQLIDTTYAVKGDILGITGISRISATTFPYCYVSQVFYDLENDKLCTVEDYFAAAGLDMEKAEEQIQKVLMTEDFYDTYTWEILSVIYPEGEPILVVKVLETSMWVEQPETIRLIGYNFDGGASTNSDTYFDGFENITWDNIIWNDLINKWESELQVKNTLRQYMHVLVPYLH